MRLKKELLKMTSSEASSSEADSSEANSLQRQIHQKQKILQTLESIDKVQCTKSTTTMPTLVPATTNSAQYPLYTTRITTTNAETFPYLVEWIWIWFHCTSLKSSKGSRCQISFGKEKVMSWKFSTSLKFSINRDEDLKNSLLKKHAN